jgi:hypothetical protein
MLAMFRSKTKGRAYAALIKSAAFSAIMMVGALVLCPTSVGMKKAHSSLLWTDAEDHRSFGLIIPGARGHCRPNNVI